ncbi:MAG: transcription termination factor NusA, partial [Bacillota bacterium]|nr:transcription termination factor NusA [Bacillota bacterium]
DYRQGARIKAYITEVRKTTKGPQIFISRTHPGLLKRLFELEVPEIYDGTVEIKSVAREAGSRSKLAVHSNNKDVDPVGACVGPKGARVQAIVNELRGEKIDIVKWDEDPEVYVANSLSPAKVVSVSLQTDQKIASVVVPDYQLSLAIGKEGQNVRLAAKLTGWKIDITSESQSPEAKMPKENPLPDDSSETVEDSEAAEINISETGADAAMEADDFENP